MSRGAAAALTREKVIDAASLLVAEVGYDGLTMRSLAQRCGVAPMTLYRHVATKEHLLGALAERLLAGVGPRDVPVEESWNDEVSHLFRSLRRVVLNHPELADIIARQHVNGRAAYAGAEQALAALRAAGLDDASAVTAISTLLSYTIGFTQRQLAANRTAAAERWATILSLPEGEFPHVRRASGLLLQDPSDEQFETGLRTIVLGLQALADHTAHLDPAVDHDAGTTLEDA